MAIPFRRELGMIVAWLLFPLIPVVLEDAYYQTCNLNFFSAASFGPDPRDWEWSLWLIMLGPLLGYGFLAGATVDLADDLDPPRRGLRRLLARRSVWVSIGPWWGFISLAAVLIGFLQLQSYVPALRNLQLPESWQGTWAETAFKWVVGVLVCAMLAYGWLWAAWCALRRAARTGRWRLALFRGLSLALAFVGSLFGSFWAATAWWRGYFFDPRVIPLIIAVMGLAATSGCAKTITYGEVRRRELFHAMLVAWVLGLALMWRWWSRRRSGPPNGGART